MKKLFTSIAVLALSTSSAFAADGPERVVELFTSQGCSSCPPANNFVASIADDPDILALTYGVTYWDYLGWKDTFAKPEFTKRQREYGKAFDAANVYTPQIVLNGSTHSSRYSERDVKSIEFSGDRPDAKLVLDDGKLNFSMRNASDYKILIVGYMPGEQSVPVKRGENGGRTLALANVVTDIMPLEDIGDGMRPKAGMNYAALVHDPKTARIVTAAVYKS